MQKITPFLWFDHQAEEAVEFYTSAFARSGTAGSIRYDEVGGKAASKPKGSVMTVPFQLEGQNFVALNGGPVFKFTPAISFFVSCGTSQEIDALWRTLSNGGTVMMELAKYPFSEKFGWLQDKFGISWQLNLAPGRQKLTPFLMFVGKQHGKAEEAAKYYTSVFNNSAMVRVERWGLGEPGAPGTVKHGVFSLAGQDFMMMDSNLEHKFTFTEATSFVVNCQTQEEVDHYWKTLSEGGDEKAQQCGWLKDKFGLSWQIVPVALSKMLGDKDQQKSKRVMQAMLQMKKIDMAKLQYAYDHE